MRRRKKEILLLAAALILSGCGPKERATGTEGYPKEAVELVAPAGFGSGYDLTARSVSQCLQNSGMVKVPVPVTNYPGGGGREALEYLTECEGQDHVLAVFSPPVCLIRLNGQTELGYAENTTPIAKLMTDYGCFSVRADSPYQTIADVMAALKEDPGSVKIGGTSVEYSLDHLQFLAVAQAAGVDRLSEITYEGFENGGAAAQLMGNRVDLLSSGISDVAGLMENEEVRILAVTSPERLEGEVISLIPTCREQGINAEFYTWRGIFGPAGMSEQAVSFWQDKLKELVESEEWQELCRLYGWKTDYAAGDDFREFLDQMNGEYKELLEKIQKNTEEP